MNLRDEARRLAKEAALTYDHGWVGSESRMEKRIESALLAFAKLVLEREPSPEMLNAGIAVWAANNVSFGGVYRAMAAELIKELTEEGSSGAKSVDF